MLGWILILGGLTVLIMDFVLGSHYITSIWTSVILIVSGGLAIGGARRGSKCLVVATLVMTVISAVTAGALLMLVIVRACYDDECSDVENFWLHIFVALAIVVAAIVLSSLTCRALCCRASLDPGLRHSSFLIKCTLIMISFNHLVCLIALVSLLSCTHTPRLCAVHPCSCQAGPGSAPCLPHCQ